MSRRVRTHPLASRPTVSVVVPCYNYGRYLPECVASVLGQDGVDVNVLIVDDASTDNSALVAHALSVADPRVTVMRHTSNRGHIATYNDGLEAVTGKYVVLLSADDLLIAGSLARATALMEHYPSVGLAYGHPTHLYEDKAPARPRTKPGSWTIWPGQEWIRRRCEKGINCIFNPEVVMRSQVQREIGGYRADLPHSGDIEMWMRAATVADVGRVNDVDQAYYRVHPASMQRTVYAGHLTDLKGRRDAFETIFREYGSRLSDVVGLRSTAEKTLATEALRQVGLMYEEGTVDAELVDQYFEFAIKADPDAPSLPAWSWMNGRRRLADHPAQARAARLVLTPYRTVEDKVRWRRWRWSGV